MKKNLFFFIVLVFVSNIIPAQTTFEQTYDNGSKDYGTSVITLSDGYIMCGTTKDDTNGDFDVFVTKVDLNSNVIWTNIYSNIGANDDYATYINGTSDGNFVVTGTTLTASGDEDVFILKIDADGNELWNKTYDSGVADDDGANYIVEGESSTLLVCGYSHDGTYSDMWVLQTDAGGNYIWDDFFGLNGDDEATAVIETNDGGLAIIGQSYDDTNGDYDGVLIKLDATGTEEWTYYTAGTADEIFNDFNIDQNGNYIIVGAEQDETVGDYDLLLESVSADGNTLNYSYTFDYSAGDDEAYRIYTDGTDFFIAGYIEDTDNGDFDAYLAQVDVSSGDVIGDVLYGDIYDDEFADFDLTTDGGFICVGYETTNASGDTDVFLVKTDANGNVSNLDLAQNTNIKIYPNPTSDFINFTSVRNINNFEIISSLGQIVKQGKINDNKVNVEDLSDGIYMLNITTVDNKNFSLKFIKK